MIGFGGLGLCVLAALIVTLASEQDRSHLAQGGVYGLAWH
jgi:hypothetical protein